MLRKEEFVGSMGQRSNDAAVKDAQNLLGKEECALGMVLRSNYAAVMDVQNKPGKEDCAFGMGQSGQRSDAVVKDAQIMSSKDACQRRSVRQARCKSQTM